MLKTLKLGLAVMVLMSTAASAQEGKQRVSETCRAEVMKLCGATKGDKQARRKCMMENRSNISENCRAELKAQMEARRAAKAQIMPAPATPLQPVDPK